MHAVRIFALWLLTSLLLFNRETLAQNATVTGATMTWYGVYTVGESKEVKDAESASGTRRIATGISPPRINNDRIPLAANTRFGFGYELVGRPSNAPVTLKYVFKFPPPGVRDVATGQMKLVEEATWPNLAIGRKDLFIGRFLATEQSAPAGAWTLQVWHDKRMLLEKSFTVEPR